MKPIVIYEHMYGIAIDGYNGDVGPFLGIEILNENNKISNLLTIIPLPNISGKNGSENDLSGGRFRNYNKHETLEYGVNLKVDHNFDTINEWFNDKVEVILQHDIRWGLDITLEPRRNPPLTTLSFYFSFDDISFAMYFKLLFN